MRQIDYIYSDYVVNRNGIIEKFPQEEETVTREELLLAFDDLAQNKAMKFIAKIILGVCVALIFGALMWMTEVPQ